MTASPLARRVSSRASAAARRTAVPAPAVHASRRPSHTPTCSSTTSTPAPRRHEITCAFRGYARSYVPKYVTFRSGRRLREDFVHERLGALPLLRALLVVARDHLADQAER